MDELQSRLAAALARAGRYKVERELGRGGMSVVYLAWDRKHECDVALKVLRPELSAIVGPERFLQEIKTAARLKHPYILKLHDSGPAGDLLYYVMPYVEGETLRQRLIRERQLPISEALRIAREVAEALHYAHGKQVIHRDIKPENILFEGGHAQVADFGIALAISEAKPRATDSDIVLGTKDYMSPEQAAGERDLDGRTDIYSLGIVLYEMLSGHVPQIEMEGTIKTLERLRPGLPAAVSNVVKRALAADPDNRFANAGQFVDALEAVGGARPFYERRLFQAVTLPVIALVIVGTWWIVTAGSKTLDDKRVVVFPLGERGRSGIGDQVALMIGSALEHTEPLEWVDGWRLLTPAERENIATVTPQRGQRIARNRGARYFLQGSIVESGDSASVILWLTDAKSGNDVARVSAGACTRRRTLPQLGLEAVAEILPRLLPPGGRIDLTMLAGRRPAAIANWLQGEREYRRSSFAKALEYFRRAVGEDSALAAAALRGAQAAEWENTQDAAILAAVAVRNARLLPARQASFARGLLAYFEGQADSAVHWLTLALRESPDWIEAHMTLGETYYHELPNAVGALDSLAAVEFAAAAAVDSGFSPPRLHLAEIAVRSGDFRRAANAIADFARAAPDAADANTQLALMLRCAAEGRGSVDWAAAARAGPLLALSAAQSLAGRASFLGCAEEGFRALLADTLIPMNYRWGALVGLQSVFAAQNRLRELRAVIDSSVKSGVEFANRFYLLDGLAGVNVGDRASAVAADYERAIPSRSVPPSVMWLLGAWRAASGSIVKAESLQRALAHEAARLGDPNAARYAAALAAGLALQRGDTSAGAPLRALLAIGTRDALAWGMSEPLAADRLMLAEFLLAHGKPEQCLAIAASIDHSSVTTLLPFLPASLVVQRQAALALRRVDLARRIDERLSTLGREDLLAVQLKTGGYP
ncbi:MAG TPA: serine/threonine-protein kinase [Gemmatimonadales bacterium]|nr:serine/threonine-protein kinase [Gemmatimonadales bacterium]